MAYDEPDFEHALGMLIIMVVVLIVSLAMLAVGYFTGISFLKWIGGIGSLAAIGWTIWNW